MTAATRSVTRGRWGIVVAAVLVQLALGAVYAWSVFNKPLQAAVGWSKAQVVLSFELSIGTIYIGSVIGGRVRGARVRRGHHGPGGPRYPRVHPRRGVAPAAVVPADRRSDAQRRMWDRVHLAGLRRRAGGDPGERRDGRDDGRDPGAVQRRR